MKPKVNRMISLYKGRVEMRGKMNESSLCINGFDWVYKIF